MASHRFKAIALSLVVACAPLAAGPAVASGLMLQEKSPAEVLGAAIGAAAAKAQARPGFAALSAKGKIAAIQAAVAAAIAASGADEATIVAGLGFAVQSGSVSASMALQVAAAVSPAMVTLVAELPPIKAALAAKGISVGKIVTASTNGQGAPSVLVSLAVAAGGASGASNPGAPYDPCAGVVAAYCGS